MQICETERLVIRTLSLNDVPELTKILSDPDVMKHSIRGVCDEAATRRFIDWCLECYASHRIGPWALVEKGTDKLVGFCGVSPEEVNGVEEIGLGYRLAKRYWAWAWQLKQCKRYSVWHLARSNSLPWWLLSSLIMVHRSRSQRRQGSVSLILSNSTVAQ